MDKIKEWWPFGKEKKSKVLVRRLVKVEDLPIYGRKPQISDYRYIPAGKMAGQDTAHSARVSVQTQYNSFMDTFTPVQKAVDKTRAGFVTVTRYIHEEGTVVPKAIAITVGGMAGFLIGMKRGGVFKRTFYSGLGMGVMAAFCYPNETVDLSRAGFATGKSQWRQFQESPEPPENPTELISENTSKDIDLYTTKSTQIG